MGNGNRSERHPRVAFADMLSAPRRRIEREPRWFALAITAAYGLALGILLGHHEMWADEIQAWLIARDSDGLLDLLGNLRYEGHPPLWYLLLTPLTWLTINPVAMQALHWTIATAAIYIVVRHAPLRLSQRALLPFGYYPLFEYGAISRNYALGMLGIVVACALFSRWRNIPWRLGAVLALTSLTSVHACILVIGISAGLVLDWLLGQRRSLGLGDRAVPGARVDWVPLRCVGVAFGGVALFVALLLPPEDLGARQQWLLQFDASAFAAVLSIYSDTLLPPFGIPEFWFSYGVVVPFIKAALFTPPLLMIVVALNLRQPAALAMYLIGVGGLLTFFYVKFIGHSRHHGFLLFALLILVWGRKALPSLAKTRVPARATSPRAGRIVGLLATCWLVAHALAGIWAAATDIRHPFSHARSVARFIDAGGWSDALLLGTHDGAVNGVVGHLRTRRAVRYVEGARDGTFVRWDTARLTDRSDATIWTMAVALAEERNAPVLIIQAYEPLSIPEALRDRVRELASFTGALSNHENFHLYLYDPHLLRPSMSGCAASLRHATSRRPT